LVAVWMFGVVALTLRLIHGFLAMISLQRRTQPIDATRFAPVLAKVVEAMGSKDLPRIVECETAGPLAAGVFRPVVILPSGLLERLGAESLRDILTHECAHALRHDGLVGLLQRVAAILFWPHPMVHRLNRQLSKAREDACDDVALNLGDPCRYARTLLAMAEHQGARLRGAAVVGLFESRSRLEDRLTRILEPGRHHPMRPNRLLILSASALLATLAVSVAAIRPVAMAQEAKPVTRTNDSFILDSSPTVIEGMAIDQKGDPVAGAVVDINVGFTREKQLPSIPTGPDGHFILPLGRFTSSAMVRARTVDGERLGWAIFEDQPDVRSGSLRLVLKPTQPLTVRVVDQTGEPVPGAVVEVGATPLHFIDPGESDVNGIARFRVPKEQVKNFVAFKDGLGADYFENYRFTPTSPFDLKPLPAEVTLTLDGARTISFKAVDSAGRPLANIRFGLNSLRKPGKLDDTIAIVNPWVLTDAAGMAYFRWFPKQGSANVFAGSLEGYKAPDGLTISATPSEDVTQTVRLVRLSHLSGRVTNPDGSPARGIWVCAGGEKSGSLHQGYVRTDSAGHYALKVPPGSYVVAVSDSRYAAKPISGIVLHEGEDRTGLEFQLGGGTRFHGRLGLDPDGKFGSTPPEKLVVPIVLLGAEVPTEFLFSPTRKVREKLHLSARPDPQGHYEFLLGPGEYEFYAWPSSKPEMETIRVDGSGEIVRDWPKAPEFSQSDLAGTVVNATPGSAEKPLPGVLITTLVSRPEGQPRIGRGSTALSDAAGQFVLRRQDVEDVLYAKDEPGQLAGFLALAKGGNDVKFALKPAAIVSGRIVDHEGKPYVETRPSLVLVDGPGERHWLMNLGWVNVDKDGRYHFTGVVPGAQYEVRFTAFEGPNRGERFVIKKFAVTSAEPVDLGDFTLPAKPSDAKP